MIVLIIPISLGTAISFSSKYVYIIDDTEGPYD
jgi:hypothetical protein